MNHPAVALEVSAPQRQTLEVLARSTTAPHQQVQRARVLLAAAAGEANTRIAERVGVTVVTVRAWRKRFEESGLGDLGTVHAGRGRKPSIAPERMQAIVHSDLRPSWCLLLISSVVEPTSLDATMVGTPRHRRAPPAQQPTQRASSPEPRILGVPGTLTN